MSNRLFQGLIHQMRDTMDCVIGVVDSTATIIACSDLTKVGTTNEFVSLDLNDSHDIFIRDGYTYKPFGSRVKPEYAVFVEGVDDNAAELLFIVSGQGNRFQKMLFHLGEVLPVLAHILLRDKGGEEKIIAVLENVRHQADLFLVFHLTETAELY